MTNQYASSAYQATVAMSNNPELLAQFNQNPLQLLKQYGLPSQGISDETQRMTNDYLKDNNQISSLTSHSIKCTACKIGLGAALGVVGGPATVLILIPSLESKAARKIIDIIANFSGLSDDLVVLQIELALDMGGEPITIFKHIIDAICKAMKSCPS